MATLPSMGLETGSVGSDRGTWGPKLNANFTKLDGHNHTAGNGEQVPTDGIDINADLSFNSLYGPKDLHALTFASVVALSSNTYNKSLFVSNGTGGLTSGELYWRNTSGNHVKLTSGNSLNVAAFVGGIGGDYTSVGAAENFDNSSKAYTLKDGSAHWARLDAGGIKLIEKGTSESVGITLQVPAALAASYSVTWPLAVPASTGIMQMDSSGTISVGTSPPGRMLIPAQSGTALQAHWVNDPVLGNWKNSVGNGNLVVSIPLQVGATISGAEFLLFGDGVADVTAILFYNDVSMAVGTLATLTVNNQPESWSLKTMTVTPHTLAVNESCYLMFLSSAAGLQLGNIMITHT